MTAEQQLRQELAALRHELRRVSDRLLSNPSAELQQRERQLRDNIELTERELERLVNRGGSR